MSNKQRKEVENTTEGVEEERKTEEVSNKRFDRPSRYTWDRSLVTLDTPLVEVPKKSHRIPKPDFDANDKKVKEIEDAIKYAIDRKKKIIEELILKARESKEAGNNRATPLRELFKEKMELKNKLQKDLNDAKANYNNAKNSVNELFEQQQKHRQKMKKAMDAEDIEERLAEVTHSLNNDLLNPQEEKRLVKEKEDLERSLPFAKPIKELQVKINEQNVKRKEYKEILDKVYAEFSEVKDEVSGLVGGLDEIRNAKSQDKEKNDPVFEEIRKEYDAKIEDLKEQKKKVKTDFRALKEQYDNEQEDIRYHDWVKKIQDNLRRDKQRQDRELQRIAQDEAEERKKIESLENPFQTQINECESIVKYCELLIRLENNQTQQHQEEEVKQESQGTVNEDDLKKEKLQVLAPKKEIQRFGGNQKKNNNNNKQNNKKTQQKENTKKILSLPLEILNAFESTKVKAPIFSDEVQAALTSASEKLAYFTAQGEQELAKKKQELLNGLTKQNEQEDDDEDKIMDDSEKPTVSHNKKSTKVYHERETDFPTL